MSLVADAPERRHRIESETPGETWSTLVVSASSVEEVHDLIVPAPGEGVVFVVEIKTTMEPARTQGMLQRFIEVMSRLPEGRKEALASMPVDDAVQLLNAALPASQGADALIGPFYDTKGLAQRWHISEQAVHKRADQAHKLLKVMTPDDVALYPSFQFDARGHLLPGLPAVIAAFAPVADRWTIARWLNAPSSRAGGRTPAELLRSGELPRVLSLAASFAGRLTR